MSEILSLKTADFEMDYFCFGKGSKPFVILPGLSIKSVMLSAEAIEQGFVDFTEDYCVYVFDRTKCVKKGDTIEKLAEDTARSIEALGLNDCHIFGASQGGMMGLSIAIKHPELVKKLVVASSLAKVNNVTTQCVSNWIKLAKEKKRQELTSSFVEMVYSEETVQQYGDYLRSGWESITDEELDRFVLLAESSSDFDCEESLKDIKCDTLIVGAENDKVVTAQGSKDLAKHLNCEIYMYEKFGHGVYDEALDFRSRVLDFMNKR